MNESDSIINPKRSNSAPEIGTVAVMVATEPDLFLLCSQLKLNKKTFRKLFISRLYFDKSMSPDISLTGPLVGAPYAAMLLETLIAWGVKKIVFLGWCGAISDTVKIGDIIVPTSAIIDEGTSTHYLPDNTHSQPFPEIIAQAHKLLQERDIKFHQGAIWSTDAVFRETPAKVEYFQKMNALAVDMETSCLFTVAKFRDVEIGGVLVVSDELSAFKWRPGFKDERFIEGRQTACRVVKELCQKLLPPQ